MRSSKLDIDVCVLGYNRSDLTRVFLPHFVGHTKGVDYKLWFLDNGSDLPHDRHPGVMSWFKANTKRWLPWAKFKGVNYKGFRSELGLGFSKGNNFLAKQGVAPWILFMNNDAFADSPRWLEELVGAADINGWDAVGPVSHEVMGIQCVKWNNQWPTVHPSKKLSGFCFLVRREVFEDIGGWDEDFLNGDEDCDISIRIRERAWKKNRNPRSIGVNRAVYVHHLCSESMEGWCESIGETIKQHFQKTRVLLCEKHDPRNQIELFYWEDLRIPPSGWRKHGVLPNGKYFQRPGDPISGATVCGRIGRSLDKGSTRHSATRDKVQGTLRARRVPAEEGGIRAKTEGMHPSAAGEEYSKEEGSVSGDGNMEQAGASAVRKADKLYAGLRGRVRSENGSTRHDGSRRGRGGPASNGHDHSWADRRTREAQKVARYHVGATLDGFTVGVGLGGGECPIGVRGRDHVCGTCDAEAAAHSEN